MERTEVLDMMSGLKLYVGMRSAYDETLATALKRKHLKPQRFVGDLPEAPRSRRSRRAQSNTSLTVAKLPLAKDVDDFAFKNTPINQEHPDSTRPSCAISRPAASSPSSATPSSCSRWNRHRQDASVWPSPSREAAFAPHHEDDSSPPSISSTSLRLKPAPVARDDLPIISLALTLSSST